MRFFRWLFKDKPLSSMDIYEIAASHRKRFLEGESKAVARIVTSYQEVEKNLQKSLSKVTADIEAYYAGGGEPGTVAASWLNSQERFKALLDQVETEIAKFSKAAEQISAEQQDSSISAGASDTGSLIKAQVHGSMNMLHSKAFEEIAGTLSNKSPLYELFKQIAPEAVAGARSVFSQSMVEGWNPRKTGKVLSETLQMGRNRATLIARTESIRAYRLASQRQMQANSDVVSGWVWYASHTGFTCPVCLGMDGSEHPVDEIMNSHPQCRCTMVPLVKSLSGIVAEGEGQEPGLDGELEIPPRQTGSEWFDEQPPDTQREMLGPGKFDLYSQGLVNLSDLVEEVYDDRWGKGLRERSLKSLREMVDAGTTDAIKNTGQKAAKEQEKIAKLQAHANALAKKAEYLEKVKTAKAAKAAYEKEQSEKLAKAKKIENANKATTDMLAKNAKDWADLVASNPTEAHEWTTDYSPLSPFNTLLEGCKMFPENTVTVTEAEQIYKAAGAYSPAEIKAHLQRKAEKKAAAHEALVEKDSAEALNMLDSLMKGIKTSGVENPPSESTILDVLNKNHPHHALTEINVTNKFKEHGVKTAAEVAIEKAQKAAKFLKENQEMFKDALKWKLQHSPEPLTEAQFKDLVAEVEKGTQFPDHQIPEHELKELYDAYNPVASLKLIDLGYPGEAALNDSANYSSIDLYIKHLVKEVGGIWTPQMVLAKAAAEFLVTKTGWNAAGVKSLAKKLGVEMPDVPGKTPAKPNVVESPANVEGILKPIASSPLDAWKLNPEEVVLGGKLTGGQGGSNPGGFYTGTDGGKYYVKFYADAAQAYNEHLANSIYRQLGITAADTTVFVDSQGRTVYVSKIIENEGTLTSSFSKERANKILDGFAADVLLANWDVVGLSYDNIVKLHGDNVARIDNGGSLLYRATAGRKKPDQILGIKEWDTFNSTLSKYKQVFENAGVDGGEGLGSRVITQIEHIKAFEQSVGGWRKYVDETVPQMNQVDRDTLVKMLNEKASLLQSKVIEVKDAMVKTERIAARANAPLPTKMKTFTWDTLKPILSQITRNTGTLSQSCKVERSFWDEVFGDPKVRSGTEGYVSTWVGGGMKTLLSYMRNGNSDFLNALAQAQESRITRWQRLARKVGMDEIPDSFQAYRGQDGTDTILWVAKAWMNESTEFMRAKTWELASWTMNPKWNDVNEFYGKKTDVVLYKANIPMSHTYFDAYVDDGSFMFSSYCRENEVIAGGKGENAIACAKRDVKVKLGGKEYTYEQRHELIKALRARGMGSALDSIEDVGSIEKLEHGEAIPFSQEPADPMSYVPPKRGKPGEIVAYGMTQSELDAGRRLLNKQAKAYADAINAGGCDDPPAHLPTMGSFATDTPIEHFGLDNPPGWFPKPKAD